MRSSRARFVLLALYSLIVSVFGGKVAYQRTPASATGSGKRTVLRIANLEQMSISSWYAGVVLSVAIGHETCE